MRRRLTLMKTTLSAILIHVSTASMPGRSARHSFGVVQRSLPVSHLCAILLWGIGSTRPEDRWLHSKAQVGVDAKNEYSDDLEAGVLCRPSLNGRYWRRLRFDASLTARRPDYSGRTDGCSKVQLQQSHRICSEQSRSTVRGLTTPSAMGR
jgi:hypothetical protein